MTDLQLRPINTFKPREMTEKERWDYEPESYFIWDGERLGEAIPFYQEDWDSDWDDYPPIIHKGWRWANHGSCWGSISNPIAWAPFPKAEDVPDVFKRENLDMSPIEKFTVYKTTDGQIFETEEGAKKHQVKSDAERLLMEVTGGYDRFVSFEDLDNNIDDLITALAVYRDTR